MGNLSLSMTSILLIILLAPLLGGLISGILGKQIGKSGAHWVTISLVFLSFILSCYIFWQFVFNKTPSLNINLYNWALVDHVKFTVGLLIDHLTVYMMVIVTFVSLMVHIYSVGYMAEDPGYQRFFSYISGFTFAMLALVMANNFLVLFFGWEGVGLVSYLLIGFWFKKESANYAALKAFIANRFGDMGFILGLAAILLFFGTLDYQQVFNQMPAFYLTHTQVHLFGKVYWDAITVTCLLLFAGAAGKSAQIPLHIWLEGSMEGPTPISALIHAATMVTAGVFMMARLSPMFEYSNTALSTVMILGSLTAFLMGLLGIVQNDIKRVVAYSTLSQLGYMIAATGASAYTFGMFHLMTHAAFKALLFLAAGSVILAMHHEQDIRKMGRLGRHMPITYICMLIGALALTAIPPFSGFYSKDLIIDAVKISGLYGASFSYYLLLGGALVTALYTFRMFFLVFHGKSRLENAHHADSNSHAHSDHHGTHHSTHKIKESPFSILLPLILLAIPAVFIGWIFFQPALNQFFGDAIFVLPSHAKFMTELSGVDYLSPWNFLKHSFETLPFYLAVLGIVIAWVAYVLIPRVPYLVCHRFSWIYQILIHKYGIDSAYDFIFGAGARGLGWLCFQIGDRLVIDQGLVSGIAKLFYKTGERLRKLQTGFVFHYVFIMIFGVFVLLGWFFLKG